MAKFQSQFSNFRRKLEQHPVSFGLIFAAFAVLYELLFRGWTAFSLSPADLIVPACYSAGLALVGSIIIELIPGTTAKRWALTILNFLMAALYLTVFYILDAYHMFMTPAMIFHGAQGVMNDYGDLVFGLLTGDLPRILLMLVPATLCAWMLKPKAASWKFTAAIAAGALSVVLIGTVALNAIQGNLSLLKVNHNYEGAIRSLGLPTAVLQNLVTDFSDAEDTFTFVEVPEYGESTDWVIPETGEASVPSEPETTAAAQETVPVTETVSPETSAPETEPATEAVTEPATEAVTEPATEAVTETATEAVTETATDAVTEPATEAVMEPATEAVTEPATEAVTEPATEAVTESATEAVTEPATEAVTEPATEAVTEPVTEPVTESTPTEPPKVYEPNILPIDYSALGGHVTLSNYILAQKPTYQNEYTGMFAGKNLILITAEALSAEVIDKDLTPTLYRMATQGIRFTEYYQPAWGGSTTTGEMSNLFGLVPDCSGGMMEITWQRPFVTMGFQLGKENYFSMAFHNNTGNFYGRNATHVNLGYDQFITPDQGMQVNDTWPQSDLEMMIDTIPRYIDHQPFNVYYVTVSGHSVYSQSQNYIAKKNYDKVKDLPYCEAVKCYLAANLELEYAMEELLRQLEEAGIADDTLVVVAPDHYPYGLKESQTWGNSESALADLFGLESGKEINDVVRDHSVLIMWSGCLEGKNITVDTPTYSLDILPTLSNLFGVPYESRMLTGRDVFSDKEPLVLWPNYSWVTEKGTYLADTKTFTPRDGAEVDPQYLERIHAIVLNRINFAYSVQRSSYLYALGSALSS